MSHRFSTLSAEVAGAIGSPAGRVSAVGIEALATLPPVFMRSATLGIEAVGNQVTAQRTSMLMLEVVCPNVAAPPPPVAAGRRKLTVAII